MPNPSNLKNLIQEASTADNHPDKVIICLGSNLGDSKAILEKALEKIQNIVNINQVTSIVQTLPVDMPEGTPNFFNCILLGTTVLGPEKLLQECLKIEQDFGRQRTSSSHYENRTLDIDILDYNKVIWDSPMLQLPHTRGLQRQFVRDLLNQLKINWV